MLTLIIQYLLLPKVLPTFILPFVFFFINRRYVWFSILLTAIFEVVVWWDELCYYESRGIVIYAMLIQLLLMTVIIMLLKIVVPKLNMKKRFTFRVQLLCGIMIAIASCTLSFALHKSIFMNIAWIVYGLMWIFHPVCPEGFDQKRGSHLARVAGVICIAVGLILKFGIG